MRLILYDFVKIPQSFFCSKKTTAPFTREPLSDRGKPPPYHVCFAKDGLIGSNPAKQSKQKNNRHSFVSEKLIITRNRVVAKQSRREGVYNRTGDLSVICFGKEEQRNECEAIKNRRKRYVACDDVAGVAESDKASLVACNNLYVPFASQKMD